jgi:formylglycine-generating enzyme required for sulfatase activity
LSEGAFGLLESEETSDQRPVDNVGWNDSMKFFNRLSQRTGRRYTLPSEAQWEFSCRASTAMPFSFGDTLKAGLPLADQRLVTVGSRVEVAVTMLASAWSATKGQPVFHPGHTLIREVGHPD